MVHGSRCSDFPGTGRQPQKSLIDICTGFHSHVVEMDAGNDHDGDALKDLYGGAGAAATWCTETQIATSLRSPQ